VIRYFLLCTFCSAYPVDLNFPSPLFSFSQVPPLVSLSCWSSFSLCSGSFHSVDDFHACLSTFSGFYLGVHGLFLLPSRIFSHDEFDRVLLEPFWSLVSILCGSPPLLGRPPCPPGWFFFRTPCSSLVPFAFFFFSCWMSFSGEI